MISDLAIILTVRNGSQRLSSKAMAEVAGRPLVTWIIERLQQIGQVVVATTTLTDDDVLAATCQAEGVPVYRGATDDVVGRMEAARVMYAPEAKFVLRAMGDCPFMAQELITRAVEVMRKTNADAFLWALTPSILPLYGCREFPYSLSAWAQIVKNSQTREHVDQYFHDNRHRFQIAYHEAPTENAYFRPYRLEVDYAEDLAVVRGIAQEVSLLAPVSQIVTWLDQHQKVAMLNRLQVEKTGPSCYNYQTRRSWMALMKGQPIIGWDNKVWQPPSDKAVPIFCKAGQCILGFSDGNGILHTKIGRIAGNAALDCACGNGLRWNAKK